VSTAVAFSSYGGPEVLEAIETEILRPAAGQIIVRVESVRKLAPHGVDAALDAIGGEAIPVSLELVGNKNRVGTIADHAGAAKYGVSTLGGVRTAGRLEELVELYERGRLRVHIQNAHPLRDAPLAHREVEAGHVRGKVVLVVG